MSSHRMEDTYMVRRLVLVTVLIIGVSGIAGIALAQGGDEFQLPPVRLKPERPTTVKPIPPTPDDREAPSATLPPAEEPAPPPATPAEETPPAVEEPTMPPAEPTLPPPPPEEPPAPEPVEVPPLPPTPSTPTPPAPPETPALPPAPPSEEVVTPNLPGKEPKAEDLQSEIIEAQTEPAPATDLTGLGEVALVEEVARARNAYGRALQALTDYYMERGTAFKLEWLHSEINAFNKIPKIQYLGVAELAGPELRPMRRIPAADQLFREGINYKDYPAFPPQKKDYLKLALEKFQTIVEKYPDSDKIDDAAFRMGEIYGGWYFEDWTRAVQCYERCWQWNPKTEDPARFNAAKIYDEKLGNRVKAVELYNRVVAESNNPDLVKQASERIKTLTQR